ncbi:KIN14B-interacting protein [Cardamine amara subsp. amara]|uniref:KIN14B-interacting protein n=1 Tax=Cardamine amara subsp. amara TaxID=228776 RepID=A0ABD1BDG5_CARAN
MDTEEQTKENDASKDVNLTSNINEILRADEDLEEIDDEDNREEMELEEIDDGCMYQLNDIGSKTSTGGWFVSEGEAVILTHDDGSCSYYDVANSEVLHFYVFRELSSFMQHLSRLKI